MREQILHVKDYCEFFIDLKNGGASGMGIFAQAKAFMPAILVSIEVLQIHTFSKSVT
jgi:hypothetical protein